MLAEGAVTAGNEGYERETLLIQSLFFDTSEFTNVRHVILLALMAGFG
jgi:hypothetical protein